MVNTYFTPLIYFHMIIDFSISDRLNGWSFAFNTKTIHHE